MPEAIAGIALPEGRPGAADEVAQTLTKAAGGFERTAATAQRAVAQVPTWQGLAAVNFHNRCATYEEAAKAAALACDRAAASVRRYGSTYDEAYARIERLQAEAEHCLERLKDAERRAAEAAGREQAARERATAAALRSPLDGGVSLAEHSAALAEADGAADDRRRYEAEAQAERTELERLQAEAAKEHERIREAGREAAVAVEAAPPRCRGWGCRRERRAAKEPGRVSRRLPAPFVYSGSLGVNGWSTRASELLSTAAEQVIRPSNAPTSWRTTTCDTAQCSVIARRVSTRQGPSA